MRKRLLVGLLVCGGLVAAVSSHPTPPTSGLSQEPLRAPPKNFGAVKGQVLNMEGQPVSWVDVSAYNTVSGTGKVPHDYTDEEGMFLIERLPPGRYKIAAEKQEDWYAPTDSRFHSAGFVQVPEVDVYEHVTSEAVVRLGPQSARLIVRVLDGSSNKSVGGAKITLGRADLPEYSYTNVPDVKGRFRTFVPPVPFRIEVSAPGYKPWHQGGVGTGAEPTLLEPKTVKQLTIFLDRAG